VNDPRLVISVLIGMLAVAGAAFMAGWSVSKQAWKVAAVEVGHAEWYVDNHQQKWRWKMESAKFNISDVHNPTILGCPFCGEQDKLQIGDKDHSGQYYIYCPTCHCEGPPGDTKADAFEGWGKRNQGADTKGK
jgi:hypothetical protein